MAVTRSYIAQKILAAFGVDALHLADVPQDKHISSSTLSIHGINRFVVPHYETLSGSTHCKLVHRGVNDTYLISSAERSYSLKVYSLNWRSFESIADELGCIERLDASGISVATPIARRDGATITRIPTPEGLRYAVLFHWIAGVLPSFADEAHSAQVGRDLARLHAAGDNLRLSQIRPRLDMTDLFERPVARIRSQIESEPAQVVRFDALVKRLANQVRQAAVELPDWGFCHGDAAHINLRVHGHRVYFFDFEWCGPGWRIYDLATYIWSAHYVAHVRNFRWRALLQGYLQERPHCAASAEFIPLFVVLRHFWFASQCIGLAPHVGANIVGDRFFENLLTFCEDFDLDRVD